MPEIIAPVEPNFTPRVGVIQSNSQNTLPNFFVFGIIDAYSNNTIQHTFTPETVGAINVSYDISGPMSGTVASVPLQSFVHGYEEKVYSRMNQVVVSGPNGTIGSPGQIKNIPPVKGEPDSDPNTWYNPPYEFNQCRTFVVLSQTTNSYFVCGMVDIEADLMITGVEISGTDIIVSVGPATDPSSEAKTCFVPLQASTYGQFKSMYIGEPLTTANIDYTRVIPL
jgi:hypothetical protein